MRFLRCHYFPFLSDFYCLPCNDSIYGQTGCEGKCNLSNYFTSKFPFCENEGCGEGYYNLNGICTNCSMGAPNCKNCTYEVSEQETNGNFVCHECESNEYLLSEFGKCEPCNTFISNCKECHYENNSKAVCDKCNTGYYPDSTGICKECYKNYNINGGYCLVCSVNKTEYDNCYCDSRYVKIGHSECLKCSSSCSKCLYDKETGKTECFRCNSGYTLDSNKQCIKCEDRCDSCELNEDNNTICLYCDSKYVLNDNKCLFCGNGCSNCLYNETSKEIECLKCENNYYDYINNTYQCLINIDVSNIYLYGCLKAQYIEKNGAYECFECKDDFIYVAKDKMCRYFKEINLSQACLEAVNLGTGEEKLKNLYIHVKDV